MNQNQIAVGTNSQTAASQSTANALSAEETLNLKRGECEEAVKEYHEAASRLSYYNAAEGPSYYAEAAERGKAQRRFQQAVERCRELGVNPKNEGYLI